MKTTHLAFFGLLLMVAMFSIGCESMPVTVSPYAGYGGSGIDYGPGGTRGDPQHVWQAGVSASFVIGGRGAVANAVPSPSLPTQIRVDNSSQNNSSNSASNSNTNTNSNSNTNTNTTNVQGSTSTTNNGFVPPGHQ